MATAASRKRVAPESNASLATDLFNKVDPNFIFKHTSKEPYVVEDKRRSGFTLRVTYKKDPRQSKKTTPTLLEVNCDDSVLRLFHIPARVFTSFEEAKLYISHFRNLLETLAMNATERSKWIEKKIAFESARNKRLCARNVAKDAAEVLPCTDAKCQCGGQIDEEEGADLLADAEAVKEIEKNQRESDPVKMFTKNTAAQLKEVLRLDQCHTLLRDCTLDNEGFTHWGHKVSVVNRKVQAVYNYCTMYQEYYNEPDGLTHSNVRDMLANPSRYPNLGNSVVSCLLVLAGARIADGLSRPTVARYLLEYKYFDAQCRNLPVTEPINGQLYGRAINCPPGGQGGFHSDLRGKHVHPNFLWNHPGLKAKFKAHMASLGSKFPSLPLYQAGNQHLSYLSFCGFFGVQVFSLLILL
jgi:hypothetical protein